MRLKSDISYVFSHSYEKIKTDSDDLEKTLHNVVILIKSVFNEKS